MFYCRDLFKLAHFRKKHVFIKAKLSSCKMYMHTNSTFNVFLQQQGFRTKVMDQHAGTWVLTHSYVVDS